MIYTLSENERTKTYSISDDELTVFRDEIFDRLGSSLPPGTKIYPSIQDENDGKYYVNIVVQGNNAAPQKVEVSSPLEHDFLIVEINGEKVYGPLEKQANKKDYFRYKAPTEDIISSRVKWFFPDPIRFPDMDSMLWKTESFEEREEGNEIPNIGINLYVDTVKHKSQNPTSNIVKRRSLMPNFGLNLEVHTKTLGLPEETLEARAHVAALYCEAIQDIHITHGKVVSDVGPKNAVCTKDPTSNHVTKVKIIDDSSITNPNNARYLTTFEAPEIDQTGPTIATDIYGFGKTLRVIFGPKDNLIASLCKDMTMKKPQARPKLEHVLPVLKALSNHNNLDLSEVARGCFESLKYEKLAELLNILSDILTREGRPLSYFEQEAIIGLAKHMPQYATKDYIEKLLDSNTGSLLTCPLCGIWDYLKQNKYISPYGRTKAKELAKSLFDLASPTPQTVSAEITVKSNGATIKRKISRKAIFADYEAIATTRKTFADLHTQNPSNSSLDYKYLKKQQELIQKIQLFFPKNTDSQKLEQLFKHPEFELLYHVILKSVQYIEKSNKKRVLKGGKKAVRLLIENLLDTTKKLDTKESIKEEVKDCLYERKKEYHSGIFGGPSHKAARKGSIRHQIIAPTLRT